MSIKSKLGTAAVLVTLLATPIQMAFAAEGGVAPDAPSASGEAAIAMGRYGNTGDTWYAFPFSNGGTAATSGRAKQDATSTYVRIDRMDMRSVKLYVDGSSGLWGPWSNQVSYWSGTAVGNSSTVWNPGEYQIMTRVNENGLSYARLTGWAYNGGGTLNGYWSPDSWGTYPKIND